jgi:hypothetical protein
MGAFINALHFLRFSSPPRGIRSLATLSYVRECGQCSVPVLFLHFYVYTIILRDPFQWS